MSNTVKDKLHAKGEKDRQQMILNGATSIFESKSKGSRETFFSILPGALELFNAEANCGDYVLWLWLHAPTNMQNKNRQVMAKVWKRGNGIRKVWYWRFTWLTCFQSSDNGPKWFECWKQAISEWLRWINWYSDKAFSRKKCRTCLCAPWWWDRTQQIKASNCHKVLKWTCSKATLQVLTWGGLSWLMMVVLPLLSSPRHKTLTSFFLRPSQLVSLSSSPIKLDKMLRR